MERSQAARVPNSRIDKMEKCLVSEVWSYSLWKLGGGIKSQDDTLIRERSSII